jgi:type III secretion system YscQ/HrcQ family protein
VSHDLGDTPASIQSPAATLPSDSPGRADADSGALFPGAEGHLQAGLADPSAGGLFSHTPDFLLDVQINVSVEVGRIPLTVREVLSLGPGQVLELQRSASEPVEVHANGRCIGRGEIVVVGEQFGVRITELGPS